MYKEGKDKPMSSTKLIVLKSKELIYTAILLALVITFIIIMIYMFRHKDSSKSASGSSPKSVTASADAAAGNIRYKPGTYQASMKLGDASLTLLVTVDENYITDVSFMQPDEAVTTMYPLLGTALEDINTQLHYVSSIDDITPESETNYTTLLIVSTIRTALSDAVVN